MSASPGQEEYRQIHLAEANPDLWPEFEGIQTQIQTKLAHEDESNVFRRTLLYAGLRRQRH